MKSQPSFPPISVLLGCLLAGTVLSVVARADAVPSSDDDASVEFVQQVLPVLRERCFGCHGPDEQEGLLRLDSEVRAFRGGRSGAAIVPGKPDEGTLLRRIVSADAEQRMPLGERPLDDNQVERIRRWIRSGAPWPRTLDGMPSEAGTVDAGRHWSYRPPRRPKLPDVAGNGWPRNEIDRFVLAGLIAEGLEPSPEAEPARRIRRLYLDLIGLPPTVAQSDEFLRDASDENYRRIVDRLLASPRYGEHWARHWLDLARYADSNGYQADQFRSVWPYRDWVIRALNSDMPFDRFTLHQLAGDLLPDADLNSRIASGFHRLTTCNVEAGVDPEENRVEQVIDRVNTTGTVWLGSTVECAQCHDHPYDPFTMRDYYRLFAYFNNTPLEVEGNGVRFDFVGPKLELPLDGDSDDGREAPTTLVMVEMGEGRPSHVFRRGDFLNPGEAVRSGTVETLHAADPSLPGNRLGLARWLTDSANPLVARVTVNRWWNEIFGRGIVATPEDFGSQGDAPSHPELLDWLAVEFMEAGWSMKHVHREIVTSATYRQSSRVDRHLLERDPRNVRLTRGPRIRLSAEAIRDNALAVSGLLSTRMGGEAIFPPQPSGIWRHVGRNAPKYRESGGPDRYRRGVYVVWRRSAPYASFVNFDAPDRASCVVDRPSTNTPLQALTLLNDPAYVEMAWGLARRVMIDLPDGDDSERITYALRRCVSRYPTPSELAHLRDVYRRELDRFRRDPTAAKRMIPEEVLAGFPGDGPDPSELAAWFFIANILLNLDETITKG